MSAARASIDFVLCRRKYYKVLEDYAEARVGC